MNVVDDLPAFGVGIDDHPIARQIVFLRQQFGHQEQSADHSGMLGLQVVQSREVDLRNQERVERRLGIDVPKRQYLVVLVETLAGNSPATILQNRQSGSKLNSSLRIALRTGGHALQAPYSSSPIVRRPDSARDNVPLSMNSSSPPTGTP